MSLHKEDIFINNLLVWGIRLFLIAFYFGNQIIFEDTSFKQYLYLNSGLIIGTILTYVIFLTDYFAKYAENMFWLFFLAVPFMYIVNEIFSIFLK